MATCNQNRSFADALYPSFPLDTALEWIGKNLSPEDVFSAEELESWAKDNGFIQPE